MNIENTEADGSMTDKVVVNINSGLKELIPSYLENRYRDVETLRAALEKEDFEFIQSLCHQIKGHGASYGFQQFSDLALEMEAAAKQARPSAIAHALERFSKFLSRVEIVYV